MSLNPNHTFDDLEGTKCSIVEKNCSPDRAGFLKKLLEANKFTVVAVKSPPPKTAVKPANPGAPADIEQPAAPQPDTYTIGVSDLSFNAANAVYNRLLKTPDGKVITPAYWKQQDSASNEEAWYWKK